MPYVNGGQTFDEVKTGRKMRWWYEALADWMLANPGAKLKDMAAQFNRRPSTISIILATDAFKAYYEKRRAEFNSDLHQRIIAKQHGIVEASMDAMLMALEKKKDTVPLDLLNDIVKTGMENVGLAQRGSAPVQVNVQTNVPVTVSVADLEEARMAIRQVEQQRLSQPEVIDATPLKVPTPGLGRPRSDAQASPEEVGVPPLAAPDGE